jgi:AbrB family looped-hinge helix DNA binding protein
LKDALKRHFIQIHVLGLLFLDCLTSYHKYSDLMNMATKTETVYFSVKGQVVIPRRLRKEFEIEEGTRAQVMATPQGILIRPVTRAYIHSLRGSLKGSGVMQALMEDRKREREL